MSLLKKIACFLSLITALGAFSSAQANTAGLQLQKAPLSFENVRLQNGAKLFINYCMNCHSASAMRYNQLERIGLTPEQIQQNLLFSTDKIGDQMKTALRREDAKAWFGVVPPDLSVITRARTSEAGSGSDWLYTYLRGFYRDEARPTGWNNTIFPNVGMPNVLWELQGDQVAHFVEKKDADGNMLTHLENLQLAKQGKLSAEQFDGQVADLVSFVTWMGEPAQVFRVTLGWVILAVLALLAVLTYLLKRAYWKDVH